MGQLARVSTRIRAVIVSVKIEDRQYESHIASRLLHLKPQCALELHRAKRVTFLPPPVSGIIKGEQSSL